MIALHVYVYGYSEFSVDVCLPFRTIIFIEDGKRYKVDPDMIIPSKFQQRLDAIGKIFGHLFLSIPDQRSTVVCIITYNK